MKLHHLILVSLISLAAIGCGRVQNPATPAATAEQAMAPADDLVLVGYARNVSGIRNIRLIRGGIFIGYLSSNSPLYDDDQLHFMAPNAQMDAESIFEKVPTVTIRAVEDGYWDAEKGTLNPPAPDWSYCRGISYSAFW